MEERYLVINAGNTSVQLASFHEGKPKFVTKIPQKEAINKLKSEIEALGCAFSHAFIASVVPTIDPALAEIVSGVIGKPPLWITPHVACGIKIQYVPEGSLGADRLANAVAAHHALPNRPVITVDIGTAINIDCVTEGATYIGGMIAPGPWIQAKALNEFTGKLPLVDLNHFSEVAIGNSTHTCIASGILLGTAGLVDRLIQECMKSMGKHTFVVATGGGAQLILDYCESIDRYDPHLTLKGIYCLGLMNLNKHHGPLSAKIALNL